MSTEDIEAIRQRMISLLVDSDDLKRKVDRIVHSKNQPSPNALLALKRIAARMDRATRELYHVLPEHLRPTEPSRPLKPRELRPGGSDGRKHSGPTPGGAIPREVRWPNWTIEQVLALADAFHEKHGKWPNSNSGRISEASPDTWTGIDLALSRGNRNLPGGTTLARLLAERRGVRNRSSTPDLDIEQILVWADDYHSRTQNWPTVLSGAVTSALGDMARYRPCPQTRCSRGIGHDFAFTPPCGEARRTLSPRPGGPYRRPDPDLGGRSLHTDRNVADPRFGRHPGSASRELEPGQ